MIGVRYGAMIWSERWAGAIRRTFNQSQMRNPTKAGIRMTTTGSSDASNPRSVTDRAGDPTNVEHRCQLGTPPMSRQLRG